MSIIVITRNKTFPDSVGVFGHIAVDGKHFCVCVENGDTLMPVGRYELVPHDSVKHPNTLAFVNTELGVWHLPEDVPHEATPHVRTTCLLHSANWPNQLEGCVAPGETVARFPQQGMGVTNSRRTMNSLLEILGTRSGHTAEIVEAYE
jgi:hypothetical protein